MSVFGFLKPVEHAVGHAASGTFNFLSNAVPGVSQAQTAQKKKKQFNDTVSKLPKEVQDQVKANPNYKGVQDAPLNPAQTAKNFAVTAVRAPFRGGLTIGESIGAETNKLLHLPSGGDIKAGNGLTEAVLGTEPIKTAQERQKGTKEVIKGSRFRSAAEPLSFLGVAASIAGDVTPLGGKGKTAAEGLEKLAKATSETEVRQIMKGTPQHIIDEVASAVAETKDPHIIKNIIDKAANPKPVESMVPVDTTIAPPIVPKEAPKTEVPEGEAINKHLETISNAQSTTPELQDAIKGLKQTHELRDTQKLSDDAKAAVEKDYQGSLTKVLIAENPSDKEVAMAEHLIVQAQSKGKEGLGEAVNIAEHLDKTLREHGRAVQAASIISRLSPEGQLLRAARLVRKVREARPDAIAKEQQTAKEIRDAVEGSAPPADLPSVRQAVKEVSNDQTKLDLGGLEGAPQAADNTGQKLAKNVEKAVTPAVKKKADALVAELTKKVKQEFLPLPNQTRKLPIDTLREVFARSGEADEAYPLAQKILREKYANSPSMLKTLEQFFGSELKLPAADSTINRAISDQLKNNGERIADVIYKSIQDQKLTVEEVASDLVKEGFDKPSALKLAEEVAKRLDKQVTEAKRSALERFGQEAKSRNQPTFQEKINKFSNLGALDDHDYLQLARAKLDLPHLKQETAKQIHELSQKIQGLPEGHDKYAAVRELQHVIASDIPKTKSDLVKEFVGLPRTILSSGDLSFGGRQGLVYATSHPITFLKAWPEQFKYFKEAFAGKDSEAYDALTADIRNHPDYKLLEKYGRLIEPHGNDVAQRSEQFLSSDMAEKIPILGRLVRGSNYAFAGLSNTLYANQFYGMVEHLRYAGITPTDGELKQIAEVVGTELGRGGKAGGFTEKHASFLATGLFAPRLMASRLNMMNPAYYLRLKGPARQEALRGLLGLSAFAVAVLGAAELAGAKVSKDPRNADFGKIRVGDTRFDVLGGYTQYIRLGAQLATGQKINSTTGAESEAGKGLAGSRLDILSSFGQGKENPSVSFVTDLLKGNDINGESLYTPKGVSKTVIQRFIPLLAQDFTDLVTHPHSAGPLAVIPGALGTGIQTYGKQDLGVTDKQREYISKLPDKEQQSAYKSFLQDAKAASGTRTNVREKIKTAISAGDMDKADSLAKEYNQRYNRGFDDWRKQYGKYKDEEALVDYYYKGVISDESIKRMVSKIKSGG